MKRVKILAILALISLAQVAAAGPVLSITAVVKEGDSVPGIGAITFIDNLAVNNPGTWLVEADTNHADTNADSVLLRNGTLHLRENDALASPPNATLDSFDSILLNNAGDSCWNFFLGGQTTSTDSGIYFNTTLVIQESNISTAPQFSPNTPYIGFFETKFNNNNQCVVMASVDDPAIASTVDRAIVRLNLDGSGGLLSETVLAKEADILPGQTEMVTDFGTGPHTFAFNDFGQVMFVADLTGDITLDGVVYVDNTIVAQEGSLSGVDGRNWMTLSTSVRLDLNNNGDYVHTGTLAGDTASDLVIVKNGLKVIQEGDTLASIGGVFTFTSFGSGPVRIDDKGNVFWFGDWNDPDTTKDTGLFWNDRLLVQEGVTVVDGMLLTGLAAGVQDGFAISNDGRWVIFEGTLAGAGGNVNAAILIEVPEPATALLLLGGMFGLRRRRHRR